MSFLQAFWHLLLEMSPYLLLGFFIAGLLHVYVPKTFYEGHLARPTMASVLKSALLGIPLPLCSCGVIPTAVSLRRDGASRGAVTSFLIATPQTGVDSILATYSLLGLPFAIVRPVIAFCTGILGGWLTNLATDGKFVGANHICPSREPEVKSHCCCHHEGNPEPEATSGRSVGANHICPSQESEVKPHCCCHHEGKAEAEVHCCHCHEDKPLPTGFWARMGAALQYAFVDMLADVGGWLVVGLLAAALITVLVPDGWLASLAEYPLLSMLLVLVCAMPMYLCATGSIPIAVSLMMKGLTPGCALVLLMAGPATNVASVLVLGKTLGRRTLWCYLVAIVAGAVGGGLFIDLVLPREWFALTGAAGAACCQGAGACCEAGGVPYVAYASAAVLLVLLLNAFVRKALRGKSCCKASGEN